ncbi:MAG: glycosyltransferase family 4 protein, partial [Candidatus Kapabacteria bacterium]|nr:glycosyltransferase family 4 protein [Candidatus Kapabacteria bacterium]
SGVQKRDVFHGWIYGSLDAVITPARYLKTLLVQTTSVSPEKVHVIPYGIDCGHYDPERYNRNLVRMKYDIPTDAFVYGIPARFDVAKDQLTGIGAIDLVDVPQSMLLLVGKSERTDDAYALRVDAAIDGSARSTSIKVLPFTNDFAEVLCCLDVYMLTSRSETFSLALLMAMASGTCVIATNEGGNVEVIRDGENGLLVPGGDPDSLAEAMNQLGHDAGLRSRLATQALQDAQLHYNSITQFAEFIDVCDRVLAARGSSLH